MDQDTKQLGTVLKERMEETSVSERYMDTGSYNKLYPSTEESLDVIACATDKCQFLKTIAEQFRFCAIDNPDEYARLGPSNPILNCMKDHSALQEHCYNQQRCVQYNSKIGMIRRNDEALLEEDCYYEGIRYIPPGDTTLWTETQENQDNKCLILGRNYPIGSFEDHGVRRNFPYTYRFGIKIPIMCAGSVLIRDIFRDAPRYILVKEPKEGAGRHRKDRGKLDIPGGGLEWGESFRYCAMRELGEEGGVWCRITGLVGLVERINLNNRLIWKAIFTGKAIGAGGMIMRDASLEVVTRSAGRIREEYKKGNVKSPDVLLAVNRMEAGMVMDADLLGTERSWIRMGWD